MKANDVTYAHMFPRIMCISSIRIPAAAVAELCQKVTVERSDPIYPFWFLGRSLPFYALRLLFRVGLLKPRFYSRLYAVASVREN